MFEFITRIFSRPPATPKRREVSLPRAKASLLLAEDIALQSGLNVCKLRRALAAALAAGWYFVPRPDYCDEDMTDLGKCHEPRTKILWRPEDEPLQAEICPVCGEGIAVNIEFQPSTGEAD